MDPLIGQIITGILSLLALVIAGRVAAKSNTDAKTIETTNPTYKDMADYAMEVNEKLRKIQEELETLHAERWEDRTWVRRALQIWPPDLALPLPLPRWVAELYGIEPTHPPTPGPPPEEVSP